MKSFCHPIPAAVAGVRAKVHHGIGDPLRGPASNVANTRRRPTAASGVDTHAHQRMGHVLLQVLMRRTKARVRARSRGAIVAALLSLALTQVACKPAAMRQLLPTFPASQSDSSNCVNLKIVTAGGLIEGTLGRNWVLGVSIEIAGSNKLAIQQIAGVLTTSVGIYWQSAHYLQATRPSGELVELAEPYREPMQMVYYFALDPSTITCDSRGRYSVTIGASIVFRHMPRGEITIVFDCEVTLREFTRSWGDLDAAFNCISSQPVTLMMPSPTPLDQTSPQSGGGISANP